MSIMMRWWCWPPALPRPPGCLRCLPMRPCPALTCPRFLRFLRSPARERRVSRETSAAAVRSPVHHAGPKTQHGVLLRRSTAHRVHRSLLYARSSKGAAHAHGPRCRRPVSGEGRKQAERNGAHWSSYWLSATPPRLRLCRGQKKISASGRAASQRGANPSCQGRDAKSAGKLGQAGVLVQPGAAFSVWRRHIALAHSTQHSMEVRF